MAASPEMRASDADRDKVAAALREHCAQGRLTMDEFDERLEQLYTARTLRRAAPGSPPTCPKIDLYGLPGAPSPQLERGRRAAAGGPGERPGAWRPNGPPGRHAIGSTVIWLIIWLRTAGSASRYPWPMWVLGPWGAGVAARTTLVRLLGGTHR